MNREIKLVVIFLMLFVLNTITGCTLIKTTPKPSIKGIWTKGCIEKNNKQYFIYSRAYGDHLVKYTQTQYAEEECANRVALIEIEGKYNLKSTESSFDGIDIIMQKYTFTLLSNSKAQDFNVNRVCNIDYWKNGETFDVTHTNCIPKDSLKTYFDIYLIEGAQIFYGNTDSGDAQSESSRPTQIDKIAPYLKKVAQ
jgi:hypothetical protein